MCDTMSIVSVINSHTSRDKHAFTAAAHDGYHDTQHPLCLDIPGKSNCVADALSRFQEDSARRIAPWLNVEADRVPPAMLPW